MSIRRKRKKMLRWERWERKAERVVAGLLCTPGSLRAISAYVHQSNRKRNREATR